MFLPIQSPGRARLRASACLAALLTPWLCASLAAAQQVPATTANPAPDPQAVAPRQPQTVTVTAPASGYRSSIDRKSYSIASDLQTGSGALADVLRKVPSVQVGSEGDVSIRGDADVTILVDGKPSALFSGPGRAQAIQSLPADQYERVEVMTNPSAAQTAAGSGGVINLISKTTAKSAEPTTSGTVSGNLGSGGRFDVGVSGAYSGGGLSLSGNASFRRGAFNRDIDTRYGLPDPTTGNLVPARGVQVQHQHDDVLTLGGALGYDLGPHDRLDANLDLVTDREVQNQIATYQTAGGGGIPPLAYVAPGFLHDEYMSASGSLGFTHTMAGDGESLAVKLSLSQAHVYSQNQATYGYSQPIQPGLYQDIAQRADFPQADLKVDYKKTLANKAKLAVGYDGQYDWQAEHDQGAQGQTATQAAADPTFAQHFAFHQQVQAAYATYEQAFGNLTVQAGLRGENTTLETNLVSARQKGRQDYFKLFPSLHLAYELSDTSQLKASYGERIQRPDETQLDPFVTERNPLLFSAGNPDLKPMIIRSYELGYEYRHKTTDLQATLFYKDRSNLLTQVTQDIGGGALLSTWSNLGRSRDLGVELVANRDLTKTLSINTSADFMHSEVDTANLGLANDHSAFVVSGRVTVNWQVTPKDFVQLGVQQSGRQLNAQGYYGAATFTDFGWRHRFDSRLASLVTMQDPFGLSRRTIAIDTPTLVDVQKRKFNYTAIFIGFTYALGGASKRPADNFDFGAQHTGGQ